MGPSSTPTPSFALEPSPPGVPPSQCRDDLSSQSEISAVRTLAMASSFADRLLPLVWCYLGRHPELPAARSKPGVRVTKVSRAAYPALTVCSGGAASLWDY